MNYIIEISQYYKKVSSVQGYAMSQWISHRLLADGKCFKRSANQRIHRKTPQSKGIRDCRRGLFTKSGFFVNNGVLVVMA